MKLLKIFFIIFVLNGLVVPAELDITTLLSAEQIRSEIDKEIEELKILTNFEPLLYEANTTPVIFLGNMVNWVAYNWIKAEGWQLSGYSWVRLDNGFRPSRIKIGIVNGEFESTRSIYDEHLRVVHSHLDRRPLRGVIFGLHFRKEF